MKNKYIYLIGQASDSPLECIDATFDSREKAQAYLDRYKDNDAEIFVCEVNPKYHTDKTSNCYFVEFTKNFDEPIDLVISNKMASAKMAIEDKVVFNLGFSLSERIGIYLFATSEEEAIELGLIRRKRAFEMGEW